MPGRKYTAGTQYRYGFNGKEEDDEVKGDGNQQDYGMRIYDTRLGRFLSVDPITNEYPELTPYQFASNSPIAGIDRDGLEFEQMYDEVQKQRKLLSKIQSNKVKTLVQTRVTDCHKAPPLPVNKSGVNGPNIFKRAFDTWFPQMMIYGSGSSSIGSKPSSNRPTNTINLGEGGDENELLAVLMVFSELYKSKSVPKNPGEEIVETTPEMIQKTLDEAKKRIEQNKKNNSTEVV